MGQLLIRNVPDETIAAFKQKAELNGRSLEQELRDVLTDAAPLTPAEKIALFRKLRATTPPLGDIDVRAAIRHGRDDELKNDNCRRCKCCLALVFSAERIRSGRKTVAIG